MARQSAQRSAHLDPSSAVQQRVDLGWLGSTVGYHLRLAQEAAFQAFTRRADDADARPWLFAILALIDSNPGITQGDLASAIGRKTSTMTPALDQLVRRGYVLRKRLKADRRTYALTLTTRGHEAMQKLMAAAIEHEREIDRLVGSQNRPEFVRILARIANGLASTEPD